MISGTCKCGGDFAVPDSFVGEPFSCESCQSPMMIVGQGGDVTGIMVVDAGPTRKGEVLVITGYAPVEIGALDGKAIRLASPQISRNHCRLVRDGRNWKVEDLASRAGVVVNGQKVKATKLKPRDQLKLGDYQLKFMPVVDGVVQDEEDENEGFLAGLSEAAAALEVAPKIERVQQIDEAEADEDDINYGPNVARANELAAAATTGTGDVCPSCEKRMPKGAKICVKCGINIKTGRSLLTSQGLDENNIAIQCENWIPLLSLIIRTGFYPVASEAFGTAKPYVIRATAIITFIVSVIFMIGINSDGGWDKYKNWMHWTGRPQTVAIAADDGDIAADSKVAAAKKADAPPVAGDKEAKTKDGAPEAQDEPKPKADGKPAIGLDDKNDVEEVAPQREKTPEEIEKENEPSANTKYEERRREYEKLKAQWEYEDSHPGEFQVHQLFTSALIHDPSSIFGFILHIGGNFLFLFVLGSGVNSLLGNLKTAILYPILAICSSLFSMVADANTPLHPNLGASGAIMGLAGMYLVLFPVHTVHVAGWWRFWFRCRIRVWQMRGFWIVLFFISFDVLATILGSRDGVGHWAHLGGFISGMVIALALLLTRMVDAKGGDLISAILGKGAWAILGKPSERGKKKPKPTPEPAAA